MPAFRQETQTLDLQLATVVECDQAGCLVRLVTSGETVRAGFSPAVRDAVRVRKQQLVAVSSASSHPEIAWRWYRGVVEEIRPEGVAVRRIDLPAGECRIVADPEHLVLEPGQAVYYGRHDEWRIVDTVTGEAPARGAPAGYLADASARIPG